MVWIRSAAGSHTGCRWVEVDEGGAAAAGGLNVQKGSAEALQQVQMQNTMGPQSVPGSGNGSH